MTFLTQQTFDAAVGAVKPSIVIFAGRYSVLGGRVAAKVAALDQNKVSGYRVDIDNSDGAHIAMQLSIREAPTVILFTEGVPNFRSNDLTDEMIQAVNNGKSS